MTKFLAALKAAKPELRHLLLGLVSALAVLGPLLEAGPIKAADWVSVALAFISGTGGAAYVSSVKSTD